MAVTLVTGALWGRLTWGVFWQWDARLTTTALLFVTYVGYLAVRGLEGSHRQRARRCAVVGLLAVLVLPLVHFSVVLWRSLHQTATINDGDADVKIDGLMLFSLFVGVVAFTLLYVWYVLHRTRVMAMDDIWTTTVSTSLWPLGAPRPTKVGSATRSPMQPLLVKETSDGRRGIHPRWLRAHLRGGGADGLARGARGSTTRPAGTGRGEILALSEQNDI